MFEVPGNRLRELRDAETERDRYREALRVIRDEQTDEGDLNWQTANAALAAWGN